MRHLMLVKLNTEFWTDIYNRDRSTMAQLSTQEQIDTYIQENFSDILGNYTLEYYPTEVYAISDAPFPCINCGQTE